MTAISSRPVVLFGLALALYLAAQLGLRLATGIGPEHDEAEQVLFGQSLAWGYSGQPPLYTWLYWLAGRVLGPGVAALAVVKTLVLAVLYGFVFAAARRALGDPRAAALASFSLLAVPAIAWQFVRDCTHSPLACAACAATLHALLRLADGARTRDHAWLGVCVAAGLLSKYHYAAFALALAVAALGVPAYRKCLLDGRLLVAVAVAVVLTLPHVLWVLRHRAEVHGFLAGRAGLGQVADPLLARLRGLGSLAWVGLAVLGPVAVVHLCWHRRGERPVEGEPLLLMRRLAWSAAAVLAGLVGAGVTRFDAHWLAPFVLFVPVLWLVYVPPGRPRRGLGLTLAGCAVAALAARAEPLWYRGGVGQRNRDRDRFFAAVADEVRALGFDGGTMVVTDHGDGARLRLLLPHSRVCCVEYPADLPPGAGGPVLLVWDANHFEALPPPLVDYLRSRLGRDVPAGLPVHIRGQARAAHTPVPKRVGFVLLPG